MTTGDRSNVIQDGGRKHKYHFHLNRAKNLSIDTTTILVRNRSVVFEICVKFTPEAYCSEIKRFTIFCISVILRVSYLWQNEQLFLIPRHSPENLQYHKQSWGMN